MRRARAVPLFAAVSSSLLFAGCEVTNPGPVDDAFIDLPASQQGLVNGSWERSNHVVGWSAYDEALPVREIFPGGQTGSYGQSVSRQAGNMGSVSASGRYNDAQQARWVAEEAIRRFEARGDVAPGMMTKAYIAAGYANRINGDYFCIAVIDGGPPLAGKHYWERAESNFTKALASATDIEAKNAAYAGRAQVRLSLGDFAGAAADAAQVPTAFSFNIVMDFSKSGNVNTRNQVYWANASNPYRAWTVNFTWFYDYFAQSGDPRTPWGEFALANERICNASLTGFGAVPCTKQLKYASQDDPIRLASGREMRLIEAEALLRAGDANWPQAMAKLNAMRTGVVSSKTLKPLDSWVATNASDAWTFVMRERAIEFWLEGRRINDLRRWSPYVEGLGLPNHPECFAGANGAQCVPVTIRGKLDWPDYEAKSSVFRQYLIGKPATDAAERPRNFCYDVSSTEKSLNPHFKDCGDDAGGCTVGGTP
jgi:starch-binding outer membrane protein, SusD/RagB family